MARMAKMGMILLAAAIAPALVAGCGHSSSDKAGGTRAAKPLVLTMANPSGDSTDLDGFVHEVARLSDGTLRIDVRNAWREGQAASEKGLIADVKAGKAGLGWAGSRSWDSVGVNSFRALHAPFLIDSYALEQRVIQSPLVKDMLEDLKPLGLVPLGVLPGPMRKPLGIARPLVAPADYQGLTIGVGQSRVADATMRALGARPVWFPIAGPITHFDAIEAHLASIQGNRYGEIGRYLTANVDLWPRPIVLFANRAAFDGLSSQQQDILRRAVTDVVPSETARLRRDERDAAGFLCRAGEQFINTTPQDMAALRRAVQPVYDELRRDPETSAFIAQIENMRHPAASASDRLTCAAPHSTATRPSPLDGVWRMTTTAKDHAAGEPDAGPSNYGLWTYVFDRGRFAITQENTQACTWGYGTFKVTGNHVSWTFKDGGGISPDNATNKPGEFFVFGWSLYRDTLTLTPVQGQVSPENFRAKPWRQISTTPARHSLSTRCPPPAEALPG
jgi:TRAP-type C4-dicarboxylate transport system substrate-binding protein